MQSPNLSPRPLRETDRDQALFVNREWELDTCRRILQGGGNLLLLGSRGMGKTTLFRRLAADLRQRGEGDVSVDGRAAGTAPELLSLVRHELGAWLHVPVREVVSRAAEGIAAASAVGGLQIPIRPQPNATQLLIDELRAMRSALESRGQRDVIVFVDDPMPDVARLLFGRLRDELWELPLVWAVSSDTQSRASFVEPPADAFWSRVVDLEAFSAQSMGEILRRRLGDYPLAREVCDRIVESSDGNPRTLIARANEVVVQQRPLEEIESEESHRAAALGQVSDAARRLFDELRDGGPASPSDVRLQTALGFSRSRIAQLVRELEQVGVVRAAQTAGSGTGRPRKVFEVV